MTDSAATRLDAIEIVAATAADVPAIVALFLANRRDHGLFQEHEGEVRRNWPNFLLARSPDGRVLGCAGVRPNPGGWAELFGVAVLPSRQGCGLGTRLIPQCVAAAAQRGVTHLWLATMKPGYFARFGFGPMSPWALPAPVLLRKLGQVFHQPADRWAPVLLGRRHCFMLMELGGIERPASSRP